MIVTPAEMRAIEEAVFAGGIAAESLMDEVGRQIGVGLTERFTAFAAVLLVYAGKGNNAGDAFVAAAVAGAGAGFEVKLRLVEDDPAALGELARKKLDTLPTDNFSRLTSEEALKIHTTKNPSFLRYERILILDGLLGIGSKGELREPIRSAAREINELRRTRGAYVIAIDAPTGLDAETGAADPDAVVADETFTVGFPKAGLLADRASNFVGRLNVVALPEFADGARQATDASARGTVTTAAALAGLLPVRPHESNKGMYGRVGILAGSVGATGAAVMCAHACARAGAGLITLLVHPDIYPVAAAAAPAEVMVKPLASPTDALEMDFDVLALGPGLGTQGTDKIRALIERWPKPMVVDADGLNALAEDVGLLRCVGGPRLLTPHPGEMKRLLKGDAVSHGGVFNDHASRAEIVRGFTDHYPVTLLLKGARTLVGEKGRPPAYNSTGNAGMATGGMGDLLTGLCAGLAGQGLSLFDAARFGAWLHGRAADLCVEGGSQSVETLLPTDLYAQLGAAFREVRAAG